MIRSISDQPTEAPSPSLVMPSDDMLVRRRRFLAETAGAWATEDGERIARAVDELFESAEPESLPDASR